MVAGVVALAAGAVALVAAATAAVAQTSPGGSNWYSDIRATSEYSVGLMQGRAQNYFYNPDGSTLSRRDWTFDNVSMFNARTSLRLLPWLTLATRSSFNLSGDSVMKEIDINLAGCPAASGGGTYCESNSGTRLRSAAMFDISTAAQFYNAAGVSLNAVVGYKKDHYRWEAIGGTANYGTLPPGLGISYQQTWSTPYLGLSAAVTTGAWTVNGRVIGSSWAKGDDQDNHHLRSLRFTEDFAKARFLSADLGVAYRFNPFFSVTADYRYQMWGLAKGPTSVTNLQTGATGSVGGDAAGAGNTSHVLSLGFKVDLQPADGTDAPSAARPAGVGGWYVGLGGGSILQRDTWTTTGLGAGAAAPNAATAEEELYGAVRQRAGLFGGYNALLGAAVLGIEADLGKSNKSTTNLGIPGTGSFTALAGSSDSINVHSNFDGSLRLRAGMMLNPLTLVYATGGLAVDNVVASVTCNAGGPQCVANRFETVSKLHIGWTAGLGFERNFAGNWFTRGEYRYTRLSAATHTFFGSAPLDAVVAKIEPADHRLTFGVGTRF